MLKNMIATSDNNNVMLFIILLILAVVGFAGFFIYGKMKKKK